MNVRASFRVCVCLALMIPASTLLKAEERAFQWVNRPSRALHPRLRHASFFSDSMQVEVGYYIYLPPGYEDPANAQMRYPAVYFLHGGRQGNESLGIGIVDQLDQRIRTGVIPPRIYVFNNGGKFSHYDYDGSLGETALTQELIPHIDRTYRTIPTRQARAIEGISMGGRGTARIMFKYPGLFCSAVPIAGGHQHEKRVSEQGGQESQGRTVEATNNSWDLARQYAAQDNQPRLEILIVVGTKDFNYEANLDWMSHLRSLHIPFQKIIVPDVPHSAVEIYRHAGTEIMQFHERCFSDVR